MPLLAGCKEPSLENQGVTTSECSTPAPLEKKSWHFSGYIVVFREDANWPKEKTEKQTEQLANAHKLNVEETYDHMVDGFRANFSEETLGAVRCALQVQYIVRGDPRPRRNAPRRKLAHGEDNISVTGMYLRADVEAIIARVAQETSEPILTLSPPAEALVNYRARKRDRLPTDTVRVMTRATPHALNASGSIYRAVKGDKGWKITKRMKWVE